MTEGEAEGLIGEIWTNPDICTRAETLTVNGTDICLSLNDLYWALSQS